MSHFGISRFKKYLGRENLGKSWRAEKNQGLSKICASKKWRVSKICALKTSVALTHRAPTVESAAIEPCRCGVGVLWSKFDGERRYG